MPSTCNTLGRLGNKCLGPEIRIASGDHIGWDISAEFPLLTRHYTIFPVPADSSNGEEGEKGSEVCVCLPRFWCRYWPEFSFWVLLDNEDNENLSCTAVKRSAGNYVFMQSFSPARLRVKPYLMHTHVCVCACVVYFLFTINFRLKHFMCSRTIGDNLFLVAQL